MNLGKLLNFFVPQFPHLLYKTEALFWELKKKMQSLEQYMTHNKHFRNVSGDDDKDDGITHFFNNYLLGT